MILLILAYLGGVLTIVSPCILPVLPFVFARAEQPFVKSGLPMLVGMAATFALVATLAALGGGWAVAANEYGRIAALALLALFGIALVFPMLAERLTEPLVALGARLSRTADERISGGGSTIVPSLLLGVAIGLLWAPCAGPILGLILTGAALKGASIGTTLLLLAYAAGAATSLALALLAGGRVFAAMKRSLGAGEWIRRGLGVAVLAAVVAIGFGVDTGALTRISLATTASLEQKLVDMLQPEAATSVANTEPSSSLATLPVEGTLPSLSGAATWLNSPPLSAETLRGKVVVVDFWTYSCINCLRSIPYVRAWAEKYKDQGLVVIGVHTPEFAFEKNPDNVRAAVANLKIDYPVAIDNDYAIWRAFNNRYWPAHYFIDAEGRIRHHHFGEGAYDKSEAVIQQLLKEAGKPGTPNVHVDVTAVAAEAPSEFKNVKSPETYIGFRRAENFVSPGGAVENAPHVYSVASPALNEWGLSGDWKIGDEQASLNASGGAIVYRFHARDLHLVLGPAADGKPVRFRVTLDGAAPGNDHGSDTDANGEGIVTEHRLYQLIRQSGTIADRTFRIEFLDPGAQAYAFTFG
jgi:cytochrome c biogenesis protein CcdA/thiol-disulfide isomerase/thioredoxin